MFTGTMQSLLSTPQNALFCGRLLREKMCRPHTRPRVPKWQGWDGNTLMLPPLCTHECTHVHTPHTHLFLF